MNSVSEGTLRARSQQGGLVAAGLLTGLAVVWLIDHIPMFGGTIPQPHIVNDYVHGWIWALGLAAVICVLPLAERVQLLHLWLAKIAVDLGAMLIYEWHYGVMGLDAIRYFRLAVWGQPGSLLPVLGDGTTTIMRFTALLSYLTGPYYHALKIVFSFIGLWGCYCFYRAACHFLGRREPWLLYVVGFTPSILFWSSILGKDPVIFLGAGLYALGTAGWLRTSRIFYALPLAFGVAIAIFVREWYGVIMVAPVLFVVGPRLRHPLQRLASVAGGVAGMIYAFTLFRSQFLANGFSGLLPMANEKLESFAIGGSGQAFHGFHSLSSMILFWPWGLFTAVFRPLPWDIHNIFTAMSAMEGTALLLMVISAVRHRKRIRFRDPVMTWTLAYLACWASLYGFGGWANLGTAVRERLEVMPILVLLGLLLGTRAGRRYLEQNPLGRNTTRGDLR